MKISYFPEPGLLNELSRRVEAAEREFAAQDLDQKLRDLEAAKQRQVTKRLGESEGHLKTTQLHHESSFSYWTSTSAKLCA